MHVHSGRRGVLLTAVATLLSCVPFTAVRGDEDDDDRTAKQQVEVLATDVEDDSAEEGQLTLSDIDLDAVKPGKYWIGVVFQPLENELLKTHLDIEQGMVVYEVLDDSPAKKAGLQKNDILVAVDDKPITDLKVLVDNIERTQDNKLTLTIVRKGSRQQVQVTPVERPAKYARHRVVWPDNEATSEWKKLEDELRKQGALLKTDDKDAPNRYSMQFVLPGFVLPDQAEGIPEDLEVTITKKGQEEAKITVKRGDEQWDVDATSLDKLPDDVRPHIQRMLGRKMGFRVDANGIDLSGILPRDLVAPRILRKALPISPDQVYELHRYAPELQKELREKIHKQLRGARRKLDAARTTLPVDVLKNIENELKALREQLEQVLDEREEQDDAEE